MAVLERIRSKGVFLLVVVGGALLAFIIGDFLNGSTTFYNQSLENIAEINGEEVKIQDYQSAVEQFTEVYKIEYQTSSVDENLTERIRQTVWDNMIKDKLIAREAAEIGLVVNENEMKDLTIGENVHPIISGRRIFANAETGQFDKKILNSFLAQLKTAPTAENQEQFRVLNMYWSYFENLLCNSRLEEKYLNLLSKSIHTTSVELELEKEASKNKIDVVCVMKPYSSVADNKVSVSEDEMKAEYESQKEKFLQKEDSRDIKCVMFDITPSQEDFQATEKWINDLKDEFSTTDNVAAVVNASSETYRDVALSEKNIDPDLRSFAFSGNTGDVFGPTLFGNTYKMARIVEGPIFESDSVKLRHIVVYEKDVAATKVLADSLEKALNAGADFAELAKKYSQVQQSANQGGEIGWIEVSGLENGMRSKCLSNALDKTFVYEENNGAIQIMQVIERTAPTKKVKLAVINAEVTPSKNTYGKIYNEVKQFIASCSDVASFEKNAKKQKLKLFPYQGLDKNLPRLGMLNNSREIIRWAFTNEVGQISDVYECGNQFVVAAISKVREKGYLPFEEVKDNVNASVLKKKKGEYLVKEMNGVTDINALAAKLSVSVDSVTQVSFDSPMFGAYGNEPIVVASVSKCAKVGEISKPIAGNLGVFVYSPINIVANQNVVSKDNLEMRSKYSVYRSVEALKTAAEIEDNRSRFY